ncbi:MAG TPA: DM13 domain-containing protein [Candidatus Limnocylindria bacterium]|nr:DM13 domain-containing protein [Candidatus Limnocylindria bacterium]
MRLRATAIAGIVGCVTALAWYLGSPLFIRTTLSETFPTTAPTAAVAISGPPGAPTAAATPATLATGELGYVDAIHNGAGAVLLIRTGDAVVLRFENVAITNAPDVHVYLSRETGGNWTPATSVYLGPLKATNGSFNYAVPAEANISLNKSVVVWCRQFSVLITWADLR